MFRVKPTDRPSVAPDVPSVFTLMIRLLYHAIPFFSFAVVEATNDSLDPPRALTLYDCLVCLKDVTLRRNVATG
jgi:hypothetical protein